MDEHQAIAAALRVVDAMVETDARLDAELLASSVEPHSEDSPRIIIPGERGPEMFARNHNDH